MAHTSRGYGVYVADDHGPAFDDVNMAMLVSLDDLAGGNDFGWTPVSGAGAPVSHRDIRFTPRHVVGVDGSGFRARATVATVDSNIWTGTVTSWTDSKGNAYEVTGYVGERRSKAR